MNANCVRIRMSQETKNLVTTWRDMQISTRCHTLGKYKWMPWMYGYAIDMDESIGQDIHMDSDTLQTIILPVLQDFNFFSWWTLSLPSDKAPLCASTDRDHVPILILGRSQLRTQIGRVESTLACWLTDLKRALSDISMPHLQFGYQISPQQFSPSWGRCAWQAEHKQALAIWVCLSLWRVFFHGSPCHEAFHAPWLCMTLQHRCVGSLVCPSDAWKPMIPIRLCESHLVLEHVSRMVRGRRRPKEKRLRRPRSTMPHHCSHSTGLARSFLRALLLTSYFLVLVVCNHLQTLQNSTLS